MPRRGPPGLLNQKLTDDITAALSNGLSRETTCKYVRVSYPTFISWYKRGKAEFERTHAGERAKPSEKKYLYFYDQVELAEAEAIAGWQNTVNVAARTDPVWAFKMMSLRDKSYRSVEVSATYDLSKATNEQLERIASGEDPLAVMADTGPGSPGTAPTPGPDGE